MNAGVVDWIGCKPIRDMLCLVMEIGTCVRCGGKVSEMEVFDAEGLVCVLTLLRLWYWQDWYKCWDLMRSEVFTVHHG